MTFNHNTNSLPEALGVEQHKYAAQLATIMTIVVNDGFDKTSKISEMMHRCVDYNILLMLATNRLLNMMEDFQNDSPMFLSDN